jgi:hypothetical protein
MLQRFNGLILIVLLMTGCSADEVIDGRVKQAAVDHPNCNFSITGSPQEATYMLSQGWTVYAIEEPYQALWKCSPLLYAPSPTPSKQ